MKSIALQRKGKFLHPFSKEDEEAIMEYAEHQIINAKLTGVRVPRSYEQLKLYFACCQKVAENCQDEDWQTKEDVDWNCRVACKIIKKMKVVSGIVHIEVGSISYDQLSHLKACNFFDRAFDLMAKKIGVSVDELKEEGLGG